jgi:hypothetical protein
VKTLLKIETTATIASVSVEVAAAAADNFQKLSRNQIRAKFSGMQLTDEVHCNVEIQDVTTGGGMT